MDDKDKAKEFNPKLHQDFLNTLQGLAERIGAIQRTTGQTASVATLEAAALRFRNETAAMADELDKMLADAVAKIEAEKAAAAPAEAPAAA